MKASNTMELLQDDALTTAITEYGLCVSILYIL